MSSQRSSKKRREKKKAEQKRWREARAARPDEKPRTTASPKHSQAECLEDLARDTCLREALTAIEILGEGRTSAKIIELWDKAISWARAAADDRGADLLQTGPLSRPRPGPPTNRAT